MAHFRDFLGFSFPNLCWNSLYLKASWSTFMTLISSTVGNLLPQTVRIQVFRLSGILLIFLYLIIADINIWHEQWRLCERQRLADEFTVYTGYWWLTCGLYCCSYMKISEHTVQKDPGIWFNSINTIKFEDEELVFHFIYNIYFHPDTLFQLSIIVLLCYRPIVTSILYFSITS